MTGSMDDLQHRKATGRVALTTFYKRTWHKSSIISRKEQNEMSQAAKMKTLKDSKQISMPLYSY